MTVAQIRPEEDVQAFLDHIKPGEINFDKRKIWRHYTKGGKLLYVNISAQNGFLEGKKVRWVLVRDMTEMKEKERLLRETLERYELTMKATKDIIWDQTAADDKVLLHGAVFENFGYRISFANMKWLEDKIHPEDMTRVQTSLLKIYENADPYWSDQFRLKCTDGTYKYISVRGYIHYTDDKKAYRSIGVVQVIQKQKEYELKIETQNKLLKELAHTVSHKLRGPVASIKGILSLIEQNKNIPPDIETEFQYLTRSIRELDEVIHQMMESANKLYQL